MTTEIDAEGLAAAAEAIDTLWSDGQDRGPAFADTEREYQEHCRSTARAAITAYLATARTSEAEPVACADCGAKDPFMYPCHQQGCPHSPTPASDDQVEAAAKALYEEDDPWNAAFPWPNPSDGPERAEAYRRLARAALAAMGSTKP